MVMLAHESGTFQATSGHLVFTAESDKPMSKVVGDRVLVGDNWRKVTGVSAIESSSGLYAPLTPSGTIVVEGVLASSYATPSPSLWLPHTAAHAAFFPLRALHKLGLGFLGTAPSQAEMHPFAALMLKTLRLDMLMK